MCPKYRSPAIPVIQADPRMATQRSRLAWTSDHRLRRSKSTSPVTKAPNAAGWACGAVLMKMNP